MQRCNQKPATSLHVTAQNVRHKADYVRPSEVYQASHSGLLPILYNLLRSSNLVKREILCNREAVPCVHYLRSLPIQPESTTI